MRFKTLIVGALAAIGIAAGALGLATPDAWADHHPFTHPDLIISDMWVVPDARPSTRGNEVKVGKAYLLCFTVRNVGPGPAGPFLVGGGGLGTRVSPLIRFIGLGANREATKCWLYPRTPPAGVWYLEFSADVFDNQGETNEGNNGRVEAITVLP